MISITYYIRADIFIDVIPYRICNRLRQMKSIFTKVLNLDIVWVLCETKTNKMSHVLSVVISRVFKLYYVCDICVLNQLQFQMSRDASLEQDSDRSLAQSHRCVGSCNEYLPLYPTFVKNISVLCQYAYQLH